MIPHYTVELFGSLCIIDQGPSHRKITHFRTLKTGALLAYLAYYPREHLRQDLITLLWPDSDLKAGRNSLSKAVSFLRGVLEPAEVPYDLVITADRLSVRLNPEAITTDTAAFAAYRRAVRHSATDGERETLLCKAVKLYRGALLPEDYAGSSSTGSDRFPMTWVNWLQMERSRLGEEYHDALRQLIVILERQRKFEKAGEYADMLANADPLCEVSAGCLMRCYAALGQPAEVWRTYQEMKSRLQAKGLTPSASLQDSARQLLGGGMNLPLYLTGFFGREEERSLLLDLLSPNPCTISSLASSAPAVPSARLVTLMGPGGSGKTRLAVEAAQQLTDAYWERVWFVSLADINEPHQIVSTIRHAMRLPEWPRAEPLEQIVQALSRGPSLLVLDNFEHLAATGGALIQTLLQRVPLLRCLITSRCSLTLSGEHEVLVQPLPTPDATLSAAHWSRMASVQLFADRAKAVRSDFHLDSDNLHIVSDLCRRLEGFPLAIELAAARTRAFSMQQLRDELAQGGQALIAEEGITTPSAARHSSLRSVMEWSYRLLSSTSKRFLAQLAIFRGGWSLQAANAVCAEPQLRDYLTLLQTFSLIIVEERRGEMRYRMLEIIREYAAEQPADVSHKVLARRHAAYYLALAEEAEPELQGADQKMWFDRLEAEHANLLAALDWGLQTDLETALRLGGALWRFWQVRGHMREGRAYLALVLARAAESSQAPDETATRWRMKALTAAGNLAYQQGDYEAMRTCFQESRRIAEALESTADISTALNNLGLIAWEQAEYDAAQECFERSLAIDTSLGDEAGIALVLGNLGGVALDRADFATARMHYQDCLKRQRARSNLRGIGLALNGCGLLAYFERDYASARAHFEESLAIRREIGNRRGIAISQHNLGMVDQAEGNLAAAHIQYCSALEIRRELGDQLGIAESFEALAELAATREQWIHAAQLLGAAEAQRNAIQAPMPRCSEEEYARILATIRAGLGEPVFAQVWQEGRTLTLEHAIACALEAEQP